MTPRKVRSRVSVDTRLFWVGAAAIVILVFIVPSYIEQGRLLDKRTAVQEGMLADDKKSFGEERVLWAREVESLCELLKPRLRYSEELPQVCDEILFGDKAP